MPKALFTSHVFTVSRKAFCTKALSKDFSRLKHNSKYWNKNALCRIADLERYLLREFESPKVN